VAKSKRFLMIWNLFIGVGLAAASAAEAKKSIHLTLDTAVDIAINNSYRTKMLRMQIERSMYWLKARQASLRTQVYMNLKSPDLQRVSDYKWNSTLYRDEIVRQNTQLWQSDLSIRQPVMLFGYPTNGYLSLNYQLYRYLQKDNGNEGVDYYNRLYVKFEQPFFLPNELKNDLEEAELNLENIKLEYLANRMAIIDDISDDYYDLFGLSYRNLIYENQLAHLERLREIAVSVAARQSPRKIESTQIELEISNVKENLLGNQSTLRLRIASLKQRLRINVEDSLYVIPEIRLAPIEVDLDQALAYGYENSPQLQRLHLNKRRAEIDVENQKGRNAFHMTLEMTYGLEKKNHHFQTLWERFDNSNSITLNAYLPIWDGGGRKARIQAELVDLNRRELQIVEEKEDIRKDIVNAFTNLKEYYQRAINMKKSMELSDEVTETSIEQYERNQISLQDLLQILNRHMETETKFLEVYLGYRRSLLDLVRYTFYDFEKNVSLLEVFDMKYTVD